MLLRSKPLTIKQMYKALKPLIDSASHIIVIQAENPDGDSLGSSLALEELLSEMDKKVSLHCSVDIPKHLRYLNGWDRVSHDFDTKADAAIIVDTVSDTLLSKTLAMPGVRHFLDSHPVVILDHHGLVKSDLSFKHELIVEPDVVATGELLYNVATKNKWTITAQAAEDMMIAILSDSLGLTTQGTTAKTIHTVASLVELGANPAYIESRRRIFMKKSAEILNYKGQLLQRIEYHLDGKLAVVHIPWEDIETYSDRYNPSVLVLDEMRLVEGVEIAIAIKTYPDGKLTGKLRTNLPLAETVSGYFGGGGHQYAAGFRTYEKYDKLLPELIAATDKILSDYKNAESV